MRNSARTALVVIVTLLAIGAPLAQFSNATPPGTSGATRGIAWGDYDRDGLLDLFITVSGAGQLFRNNGNGTFTNTTPDAMGVIGDGLSAAWADIDNDGWLDLLVTANGAPPNHVFHNEDGQTFTDLAIPLLNPGNGSGSGIWGDFNSDGLVDFFVTRNGSNLLVQNQRAADYVDATPDALRNIGGIAVAADFDNDNDLDLYLQGHLFRNGGAGNFTDVTPPAFVGLQSLNHQAAAWGDFDDDGWQDIVVSFEDRTVLVFRNNGDGTFSDIGRTFGFATRNRGVSWGDYDNDGDLDLYVANDTYGDRLYRNDRGGVFTDVSSGQPFWPNNGSTGTSWGDYDADGRLDLAVASWWKSARVYRNGVQNGNHWLELDLDGMVSNRAAIGARIRVVAGGATQYREVSGGEGCLGQPALRVHVGLGWTSTLDTLEVRWPSGLVTTLSNVPVDQRITVVEEIAANTNAGTEVFVRPVDRNSGGTPVDVTFSTVTAPGYTSLTLPTTGPHLPLGTTAGVPPLHVRVATTAQYTGTVSFCVRYSGASFADPAMLRLLQYRLDGQRWEDITTSLDASLQTICGTSDRLDRLTVVQSLPVNTTAGQQVVVAPPDMVSGDTPVTLTFQEVLRPGLTALSTAASGPALPAGYRPGQPPQYYNVDTTAAFDGSIDVCINYTGTEFADESSLRIFVRAVAQDWQPVSTTVETTTHRACGSVPALPSMTIVLVQPNPPIFFDDATPSGTQGATRGIAWGDYDRDGLLDLFITATYGNPSQLLRNNGDGAFTDVTPAVMRIIDDGLSAAWADIDNDGWLDLLVTANGAPPNHAFHNEDGQTFTDLAIPLLNPGNGSGSGIWGDFNSDGLIDFFLTRSGSNLLAQKRGPAEYVDATPDALRNIGGIAVAADFDNDSDLDLYLQGHLFRNEGAGNFTDVTPPAFLGLQSLNHQAAAWGDFDNDGWQDIVVSFEDRTVLVFRNNGDGTFSDVGLALGSPTRNRGVSWGDYDNDGDLDLYLANDTYGDRLYRNDGGGVLTDVSGGQPFLAASGSTGTSWGDYDGDGRLDLAVAAWGGTARIYHNDLQNGNHWLEIDLDGVISNRAAIGARVRIVTGGIAQYREVSGGEGCLGQQALRVHFGLGSATAVETLEVRWPSGLVTTRSNVPGDQRITVIEEAPANTSAGTNVRVQPIDRNSGGTPMDLTFSTVTAAGYTSLGVWSSGPDLPLGTTAGVPSLYFRPFSTAQYTGVIEFCVRYSGVSFGDPAALRLIQYREDISRWEDITTTLDTVSQTICGASERLDVLAVVQSLRGDTSAGTNVLVQPVDRGSGAAPVHLTFSTVMVAGVTTLELRASGPNLPLGTTAGTPPLRYQAASTAQYTGAIEFCVRYSGASFGDPATLRLIQYRPTVSRWEDITTSLDTGSHTICGTSERLEELAVVQSQPVNTVPGEQVVVTPPDLVSGATPVTVTLRNVVRSGLTALSTTPNGPALLPRITSGGPARYYNLDTTASCDVSIDFCIDYSGTELENETGLQLFARASGQDWQPVSAAIETGSHQACGSVPLRSSTTLVLVQPVAHPVIFEDATPPVMQFKYSWGAVSWVDYDGNGTLDLYAGYDVDEAMNRIPDQLFRNDGSGGWSVLSPPPNLAEYFGNPMAWGDVDNDGLLDLLQNGRLLHNDGNGQLSQSFGVGGVSGVWLDYDRDGKIDIFTGGLGGSPLLKNDGPAGFVDPGCLILFDGSCLGGRGGLADNSNGFATAADYDNDGDPDLLGTGLCYLLRNEPGYFDFLYPPALRATWAESRAASWGDYDNDGFLDLFIVRAYDRNALFHNDGNGGFTEVTDTAVPLSSNGYGSNWADFNNDSWLDLFVAGDSNENRLFMNNGDGTFSEMSVPEAITNLPRTTGSAVGDYDGDGRVDLALNFRPDDLTDNQHPHLLRNVAPSLNHWIELDLRGVVSNAAAIGARVKVYAAGLMQIREIASGSGHGSQDSLTVHFGLGPATVADRIEIAWPSGLTQELRNVPADQRLWITEGRSTSTPEGIGVSVSPSDPTTGGTPVTFRFDEVTRNGYTSVRTSPTGPDVPDGYFAGSPLTYLWLATDAHYTGSLEVCVSYAGTSYSDESKLVLLHGAAGGTWRELTTTSLDPASDLMCASIDSLGPTETPFLVAVKGPGIPAIGLFGAPKGFPVVGSTGDVAIADFNRDGNLDVATGDSVWGNPTILVLLGDGQGGLGAATPFPSAEQVRYIVSADFNGDETADVAAIGGSVQVLFGDGHGNLLSPATVHTFEGEGGGRPVARDFDRDGDVDLALTKGYASVVVLLNNGAGEFPVTHQYDIPCTSEDLTAGDFDGDGTTDLATVVPCEGRVITLIGDGNGAFPDAESAPTGADPWACEAGDFNADGTSDLAVADGEDSVLIFLSEGATGLSAPTTYRTTDRWPWIVRVADFNGDGDLDIASIDDTTVTVRLGNGTGVFGPRGAYPFTGYPNALRIADMNNDRAPDLVIAGNPSTISVFLNVSTNTPVGEGTPPVRLTDAATGTVAAEVQFANITSSGFTGVTTSMTGPALPQGFQLGSPPTYFDVATTATYSPPITICINYAGVTYPDESSLQILHGLPGGGWEELPDPVRYPEIDKICAVTESLSPFVVAAPTNRPPVSEAGNYGPGPVEATSPAGAFVVLDGSGSLDPDGDSLSYTWSGPFGTATGPSPTVALPFGTHYVTLTVSDGKGAFASDTAQVVVRDTTPPTIAIVSPTNGAIYTLNQGVTASFTCEDTASAVAVCNGSAPNGAWLDTASVGPRSFSVTATDGAGNTATATATYRVLYAFTGFLQPVDNLPVMNVVNAGRTIPIKWRLADAAGAVVSATSSFVSLQSGQSGCDASPTDTIPDSATTLSAESLQFDAAAGQFIYNWRTEKSWAGSCRQVWLTLADGSLHTAKFRMK